MNKRIALAFAFIVISIAVAFALDYPLSLGFGTPISATLNVATDTPVIVGARPANCHSLKIFASGGDINYGPSNIATGILSPYVASGEEKLIMEGIVSNNPTIYTVRRDSSKSPTAVLRWY